MQKMQDLGGATREMLRREFPRWDDCTFEGIFYACLEDEILVVIDPYFRPRTYRLAGKWQDAEIITGICCPVCRTECFTLDDCAECCPPGRAARF